jgi:cell division protein FtsW (lipid II flippase)
MDAPWWRRLPVTLLIAVVGLTAIGLDAVHAATESWTGINPAERQLVWAGVGLVGLVAVLLPSYAWMYRAAYLLYGAALVLLVVVLRADPINGSRSWLRAGPIGMQPSELMKLAYLAALARYHASADRCGTWRGLWLPGLLTLVPMGLILKQPDLGTALLFPPALGALWFCAGVPVRRLVILMVFGVAMLPFAWRNLSEAQRARITDFLAQNDTGERPRAGGYQLYQSKFMIALGGVRGSELALEEHLPMAHNDFVFSVVAGRWGLVGAAAVVALFALLIARGCAIAASCEDAFGRLFAVGIVAQLAAQGIENLAMTVGLAPITGLTLPFVSYGGSSLVVSFLAVGILLNIGLRRERVIDLPQQASVLAPPARAPFRLARQA